MKIIILLFMIGGFFMEVQGQIFLTSSTPTNNDNSVARNADIVMDFNFNIDGATVNSNNIIVSGSLTGIIPGAFSGGGTSTITFDPTNNFKSGEVIWVTLVKGGLTGFSGGTMQERFLEFRATPVPITPSPDQLIHDIDTSNGANALDAADMDGDGDVDVLGANQGDGRVRWYENNGFQNFTTHGLNYGSGASSVEAVDMDGDGDMDAVAGFKYGGEVRWIENDGSQNFTGHTITTNAARTNSVYAADIDGDGDMDALSASIAPANVVYWYENDGSQGFTQHTITNTAIGAQSVYSADVDGDGDVDVLVASSGDDTVAWHENDGSQNFTPHIIANVNKASSVYTVDMDGDGDLDVISGSDSLGTNDEVAWHENDGSQNFTEHLISNTVNGPRSVYAADMNGDGEMDVLTGSKYSNDVVWFENDGSQNFTNHTIVDGSSPSPGFMSVLAVDMDSDGNMDVLSSHINSGQVSWYEFFPPDALEFIASTPLANTNTLARDANIVLNFNTNVDAATVNSNNIVVSGSQTGIIDGIFSGGGGFSITFDPTNDFKPGEVIRITLTTGLTSTLGGALDQEHTLEYRATPLNIASLTHNTHDITTTADGANSVYAADIDGDGDMDALSASENDNTIAWYENDGSQSYTAHQITTTASGATAVYAADIDGDGDMDALSASLNNDTVAWYENDGSQNFTAHTISTTATGVRSISAMDMDGDGDMDVLSANNQSASNTSTIIWHENDGSQNFTANILVTTVATLINDIYSTDIDGDGYMDIVSTSGMNNTIAWHENDGSQNFTSHSIGTNSSYSDSVYAVDMDGDGDMDILNTTMTEIIWRENDGSQSFTSHVLSTVAVGLGAFQVYAVDMDGDGDMDALSASESDNTIAWYENDGSQNFTAHTISTTASGARSAYAADMDADGDMDVVSASFGNDKITWYEFAQPFQFVSSAPVANTNTMARDADIELSFNADIDAAVVNNTNIVVTGSQTGMIAGTFSGGGTPIITFDPTNDFEPGEIIRVTITTGLTSTSGGILAEEQALEFRAAPLAMDPFSLGYTAHTVTTTADGAHSIFVADMDSDGDMDILSGNFDGDEVVWYENDGTQNYTAHTINSNPTDGVRGVYAADFDLDGDMDAFCSTQNGNRVMWYENDGSQNFTDHLVAISAGASSVYSADVDGDGDMDILNTSGDEDVVAWYENINNNGSIIFSPHIITTNVDAANSVYSTDLDGDGDMDVLSASIVDDKIAWYENDGLQNFTQHNISTTADQAHSVYSMDMDNDGDMDVLSASRADGKIAWYENDGSQNFTEYAITTAAQGAFQVYAADMDGDGDVDVLSASHFNDTVAWYENDGFQNFTAHDYTTNADAARSVYAADMDGDGDMDAVSASQNDDSIVWYEAKASILYTYDNNTWTPQDPNGNATSEDDVQVLSGTTAFTQDIEINNLTVVSGATLDVEGALTINGDITNNGNLVFVSNASGTGQLGEVPAGSTVNGIGEVTVQRYIPGRRAFRFVSSAVTTSTSINANWQEGVHNTGINYPADNLDPNPGFGTHITGSTTGANGFDATYTGNPSLFDYDNATQTWGDVPNTNVLTLDAGTAYRLFVRGDRSTDMTTDTPTPTNTVIRATGDLYVGSFASGNLSTVAGDFNFVGNPYQAVVDMNDVLADAINLNTTYYYIWDPNLNVRGAYVLVSLPNGTPTPGGSDANEFLQPGQAAFVATLANGNTSILFEESDKAVTETETDVFKSATTASIALNMYESSAFANGGPQADGFLVNFTPGGNNGVDANDAVKPPNIDENVGLENNGTILIMENRDMPTAADVLQLYNDNYRHSDYVFQIEVNGLDNVTAYLNDAYLGTQTQLSPGMNEITFSVDESIDTSIAEDRFSITFGNLSLEEETLYGFELYPNPVTGGSFVITAPGLAGQDVQVSLHDLLGRSVFNAQMSVGADNRIEVQAGKLQTGVYMVQLDTEGKSFTRKLIVE